VRTARQIRRDVFQHLAYLAREQGSMFDLELRQPGRDIWGAGGVEEGE
jgi:hypothetical protein